MANIYVQPTYFDNNRENRKYCICIVSIIYYMSIVQPTNMKTIMPIVCIVLALQAFQMFNQLNMKTTMPIVCIALAL